MGKAELDDVIARAIRVPKGAAVFDQGQTANAFYVLLHGRLKVVQECNVVPHASTIS